MMIKIIKKFGYRDEIPAIAYDHIKKYVIMGNKRLEVYKHLGEQAHSIDGLDRKHKLDDSGEIVPDL